MYPVEISELEIMDLIESLEIQQAQCKLYNAKFGTRKKGLLSLLQSRLKEIQGKPTEIQKISDTLKDGSPRKSILQFSGR